MAILIYAGTGLATWLLWIYLPLYNNYMKARTIGLPVIVIPTDPLSPLWAFNTKESSTFLTKWSFGLLSWSKLLYWSSAFDNKYYLHKRIGPAFVLVTTGKNWVYIADPEAADSALSRRKEFIKPRELYGALELFGKNLDSVEGDDWARHRKLTAPNFNERLSSTVWAESLKQTRSMSKIWMSANATGVRTTAADAATLALNVLTHAGFGFSYSFEEADSIPEGSNHKLSYRDCLLTVLHNFILLVIFPTWFLKLSFMPKAFRASGEAAVEYQSYIQEVVDREKEKFARGDEVDSSIPNLMSSMVKASNMSGRVSAKDTLSDEEIYGNVFIYNLAGHETTANAITFAITLLSVHPEVQGWIAEEILHVVNTEGITPKDIEYEAAWHRLKRCRAVMYETLRLYGSVGQIPKSTPDPTAWSQLITLRIAGDTYTIPPSTFVVVNNQALQTAPTNWDKDSLTWRPDRWIIASPNQGLGEEQFFEPKPGTFLAWADGPRVCPGKKFAQVEFVAVMVALFGYGARVDVAGTMGKEEKRQVIMKNVEDVVLTGTTVKMKDPGEIPLTWTSTTKKPS